MKNTNHYDLDLGLLLLSVASHNKGLAAHLTPQAKEATGIPMGSTSNWTMNFTPTVPSSPGSLKTSPSSTMQRTMPPEEHTFITPPGHSPRVISITRARKVNRQKVNNWTTNMRTKDREGNGDDVWSLLWLPLLPALTLNKVGQRQRWSKNHGKPMAVNAGW